MAIRRSLTLAAILALAAPAAAAPPAPRGPAAAQILVGTTAHYRPLAGFALLGGRLEAPLSADVRFEGLRRFPLDRYANRLDGPAGSDLQVRIGLRYARPPTRDRPFGLHLEYEHDVITGAASGKGTLPGDGLPYSRGIDQQIRKAYARVSLGNYVHLSGGIQLSHWGLGLVANGGANRWTPGSAAFVDPRSGDRVVRLAVATGPWLPDLGLFAIVGYDWVLGDDIMLEGDSARQMVGAVVIGYKKPFTAGIYAAWRTQESAGGASLTAGAIDLYARGRWVLPAGLVLELATEGVVILGDAELGPSVEHPTKELLQLGLAARASVSARSFGLVLDFLYASGDANFDDGQVNNFQADPNYEMGLLLYRNVIAAQTGRAPVNAGDPDIVGVPSADLERLPTRGSPTNTVALFPRVWWRPLAGLEVYGGPLFAFANVSYADAFNTRVAGATRSPLGGAPGSYFGTEVDLGVRYRMLLGGTELTLGAEGGVLFPGSAFEDAAGDRMNTVWGGRALVSYRL